MLPDSNQTLEFLDFHLFFMLFSIQRHENSHHTLTSINHIRMTKVQQKQTCEETIHEPINFHHGSLFLDISNNATQLLTQQHNIILHKSYQTSWFYKQACKTQELHALTLI